MATAPEARGLLDDVAVLDGLVITHDSIAENIHFLSTDPPSSVGWKLVAVNLSDLAAKGASPRGALLSLTIAGDDDWEELFLSGVEAACESYALPLIGGDTIALPPGAPRVLGMTAIGRAGPRTPDRAGGRPGDRLWVVGTLGDSAAGLAQLRRDPRAAGALVDIYRRPIPQLGAGGLIAPRATAMMDVSDGLLLDARRMAEASGCRIADRPRRAAAFAGLHRISRRHPRRAPVRRDRRRRLCLARRLAAGARPLNPFFTGWDDDSPRGQPARRRPGNRAGQRRAPDRTAGDIGF